MARRAQGDDGHHERGHPERDDAGAGEEGEDARGLGQLLEQLHPPGGVGGSRLQRDQERRFTDKVSSKRATGSSPSFFGTRAMTWTVRSWRSPVSRARATIS